MKKSLVAAAVGATFALGSTGLHRRNRGGTPSTRNLQYRHGRRRGHRHWRWPPRRGRASRRSLWRGVRLHREHLRRRDLHIPDSPPSPLHHRVRKIDKATGIITTVAGTGAPGPYTGEYQFATLANITAPIRVVFDRADNFYINGATGNNRIQKVDAATGLITTVAGHLNGDPCPAPRHAAMAAWPRTPG